jgi:hypothetical protein
MLGHSYYVSKPVRRKLEKRMGLPATSWCALLWLDAGKDSNLCVFGREGPVAEGKNVAVEDLVFCPFLVR